MKISTVSEMRALDRVVIERFGIAEELLMENAGLAVSSAILQELGIGDKHFLVFCGPGNNGGDGFVVARKIHSNGGIATVYVMGDRRKFKGAAKLNLDIVDRLPIEVRDLENADAIQIDLAHCDVVVDGILGTGLTRNVDGIFREVVELINHSGKPVVSIDIPSGVNGDSGQVMGIAVKADCTVTFGLPKVGHMLYPGHGLCGRLYTSHISFSPSMYESDTLRIETNSYIQLPPRVPAGHKGSFGDVLFIAGAATYYGAPYFAALSFLKAGGGFSRLAAPKGVTSVVAGKASEIVYLPQRETPLGSISVDNVDSLRQAAAGVDMVVLGPGLSLDGETQDLVRRLAAEIEKPILLDGDGITAVCNNLDIVAHRSAATILTPHLGEMARLTGLSVSEIEADKIGILRNSCQELNAVMVLKGAHSLIGYPDGSVFINLSGNSGMASAGSGDVLTGTIAAMFGLGLPIPEAARKGVFIHGLAGDLAADERGEDGITAQNLLDYLPKAMKLDRQGPMGEAAKRCQATLIV